MEFKVPQGLIFEQEIALPSKVGLTKTTPCDFPGQRHDLQSVTGNSQPVSFKTLLFYN